MVVLQAFINISVVLGMMPTKGIPLPLVSYGGSSLVCDAGVRGRAAEYYEAGGMRRPIVDCYSWLLIKGR